ncbi:hypothetical protein [Tepidimicrobium xylanilyticum]
MLKNIKNLLKNKTNFRKGLRATDGVYALALQNQITPEEKESLEIIGHAWKELKKRREDWEMWAFRHVIIWRISGPTEFWRIYGNNLKRLYGIESLEHLKKIMDEILVEMLDIARDYQKVINNK